MGSLLSIYENQVNLGFQLFFTLAAPSPDWTKLVDGFFFLGSSALLAWYFYYYQRKDLLGKFWGALVVASIGSLIVLSTSQMVIYETIMWLMSPKIGNTQLSNLNLIVLFLGGYLALYVMNRINHNKERRD